MRAADDYDDDDEVEESSGSLLRWLAPLVVTTAVASFVTLAWYAYNAGTQSLNDDNVMVVEADKTPIKEKPADPGGMKVPNQDKTIFDTFDAGAQQQPKVENILPAPEEPLPKNEDASGTTTWVNDKLHAQKEKPEAKSEQVIGAGEANLAPAAGNPAPPPEHEQPSIKIAEKAPEKIAEKAPEKSSDKPAEKPAQKAPLPVPAQPAPHAQSIAGGSVKAQLGAYRSEKEAKAAWERMQKKYPALAGHDPMIVRADLGSKGVYYRLRVGGFASAAAAKAFCGKLGAQACVPVG